jgi:hypothetical protein
LQSVCPDNSLQTSLSTKAYISSIKQLIKILEITCLLGTVLLTKAFHGFPSPHRTYATVVSILHLSINLKFLTFTT